MSGCPEAAAPDRSRSNIWHSKGVIDGLGTMADRRRHHRVAGCEDGRRPCEPAEHAPDRRNCRLAGGEVHARPRGRGFGVLKNILVGIVGAVVGGILFGLAGFRSASVVASLVTA